MNLNKKQFGVFSISVISSFFFASTPIQAFASTDITPTEKQENHEPQLVDQCVGGTAHELVAQANIVTAKKFPEYGLSEALSAACPRFVWVVLQADSLSAAEKKRAFSNVLDWTQAEKMRFFAPLKQEVDEAAEQAWSQGFRKN